MTHTPGPWTAEQTDDAGRWFITAGYENIVSAQYGNPLSEANARLIAAAPDLLAALRDLFDQCAMVRKHWGDGSNQAEADNAIRAGQAAIAKAEGRQP